MARFDARPPSFVSNVSAAADGGLVLLSGSDRNAALSESVVANHHDFAKRHSYMHWWHRGSLVDHLGWLPYWHKIAHLRLAMRMYSTASAFVWIDDDIVLTNHLHDMFRHALDRSNATLLVTRDPAHHTGVARLNTGIMILRNGADAELVLDELWRRATEEREDGLSLATDPQSAGCLHEQQALQEMVAESSYWRTKVAVLSQRDEAEDVALDGTSTSTWNLNTFLRWSHHNAERDATLDFEGDATASRWRRGDFAGHCSGLSPVRRSLCVSVLLRAVVS